MIKPKEKTPNIIVDLVNDTNWSLEDQTPENFTMIVVYRGKHCPVCKIYLEALQTEIERFTALGVDVIAISSDTKDIAKNTYNDWNIADIPVGYGFPIEEAREWGLFISSGIKDEPKQFIEPGLFLIKPDQTLYAESIQSMPFARSAIKEIYKAIEFVLDKDYPARGEA